MTITVESLRRAKAILTSTVVPDVDDTVVIYRNRVLRKQDESILSQFEHHFAIDCWRDRFIDSRNNPFR